MSTKVEKGMRTLFHFVSTFPVLVVLANLPMVIVVTFLLLIYQRCILKLCETTTSDLTEGETRRFTKSEMQLFANVGAFCKVSSSGVTPCFMYSPFEFRHSVHQHSYMYI